MGLYKLYGYKILDTIVEPCNLEASISSCYESELFFALQETGNIEIYHCIYTVVFPVNVPSHCQTMITRDL